MLKSILISACSTLFAIAGVVMFPVLAFATKAQEPFLSNMFTVAAVGFMVASVVVVRS